jgi:RNA polymerase sigma-70 factor, ECF subfamily
MRSSDSQASFVDRLDRHRGVLVKVAGAYCRDALSREDLIAEIVAQLWRRTAASTSVPLSLRGCIESP